MTWRVMLCRNGESGPCPIIEVPTLGDGFLLRHKTTKVGVIEERYMVTHVGTPGQIDENHATADFLEERVVMLDR